MSLDVFRGIVVAVALNTADDFARMHWRLGHADWNGFCFDDWGFPAFLFIVGMAVAYSISARMARGHSPRELIRHAAVRSLVIFAIGVGLEAINAHNLHELRFTAALPRIAIVYFFTVVLAIYAKPRTWAGVTTALLVGYWLMMRFIPVPGIGAGHLDPANNLAAYIDQRFLLGHLLWGTWDPEGILTTLPAVASCLLGLLTANWLRTDMSLRRKATGILIAGAAMLLAGIALQPFFPINKNLWTSTFVLLTTGISLLVLGMCYWMVEIKGWKRLLAPLIAFGMNPLLIYVLSRVIDHTSRRIRFTLNGEWQTIKLITFNRFFAPLSHNHHLAWVYWCAAHIVFFWVLATILYRRKIFVRI